MDWGFFINSVSHIRDRDIKESMRFRLDMRGSGTHPILMLGNMISKRHGIKFLTGDRGFKYLPNAKYVK
jgi:hypothetical protein